MINYTSVLLLPTAQQLGHKIGSVINILLFSSHIQFFTCKQIRRKLDVNLLELLIAIPPGWDAS